VCSLVGGAEAAHLGDDERAVDTLLLSAFLDDLRAAYDPGENRKARLRTASCVVLIDDIDRLAHDQTRTLFELLAARRSRTQTPDPLLLVVTTQRRGTARAAASLRQHAAGSGDDPTDPRTVYENWRAGLDRPGDRGGGTLSSSLLPVDLPAFSERETRLLLAYERSGEPQRSAVNASAATGEPERPATAGRPPRNERGGEREEQARSGGRTRDVLAEEVFRVTHGHPLAVDLIARSLESRERRDQPPVAVRALLAEPVPAGTGTYPGESSSDYLLRSFTETLSGRLERPLLAACAAPRRLDVASVRVALDLPDDPAGSSRASTVWEDLADCAFTEIDDDGRLILHPLLRDLLARDLATADDQGDLSHTEVHTRLARHFSSVAAKRPEAVVDYLYHELALDRLHTVVRRLDRLSQSGRRVGADDVLAITSAPWALQPSGRGITDVSTVLRGWWQRRGGILLSQLEHARRLYSPTSDAQWSPLLLDETRRLREAANPATVDGGVHVFRHDESEPYLCAQRYSYDRLRRTAVLTGLALPVIAYLGLYGIYVAGTCDPAGPLAVRSVLADRLGNDGVYVRHTPTTTGQQCVGVTDGSYVFGPRTRTVQRDIAEENAWVSRQAKATGRPYVTAVVMTSLTPVGEGGVPQQVTAGRDMLRGVYLAQHQHNRTGYVPMMRVLVANTGTSSERAGRVARQIVEATQEDDTIVAILGPDESGGTTPRATRILGRTGLPLVATTASGDSLRDISDHLYRIAAPNQRQAEIAALYAKKGLHLRRAVIVVDPHDAYSEDLASDFRSSYTDRRHTLAYPSVVRYDARHADVANELFTIARRACLPEPDLIYFAGRARETRMFVAGLRHAHCGEATILMGGHTLSRLQAVSRPGVGPDLPYPLYYTALSAPDAWRAQHVPSFYREYHAYLRRTRPSGAPAGESPPASEEAVLAYDGTRLLSRALALLPDGSPVDPFTVWRQLDFTTDLQTFSGASGLVDFGADPDGDPRDKAVSLVRLDSFSRPGTLIGTCGFLREPAAPGGSPSWCPRHTS
ncbi:MAG: hypothetical protein ACRDN9_18875, partial [Streptosporangiaceae bacterium]